MKRKENLVNYFLIIIVVFCVFVVVIVTNALQRINECVGSGNSKDTLKALQNPNANLPFPYLEAMDYYTALVFEKSNGLPSNVTVSLAN